MSQASEVELLMLELINQERTSRGLDPLTINNDLNATSEDHSQWMLDNQVFSHTGAAGSSANDRIDASDYALEGSWRTAENIGWQSERGDEGIADDVADIHESLMNSPGHRANILNPDLEDIGLGVEIGDFQGFDGVVITQNFGRTDAVSDTPEQESAPVVVSDNTPPVEPEPVVDQTPIVAEPVVEETPVAPDQEVPAIDPETVFDQFGFGAMDPLGDVADDMIMVTAFQGTITTPDSIFTTDDRAAFEAAFMEIFASFNQSSFENMDFG